MDYRDYVTFEAAQALADAGYCEKTEMIWVPLTRDLRKWRLAKDKKKIFRVEKNEYLAPTLMQARRWLLDQYEMDIVVRPVIVNSGYTHKMYTCDIYIDTLCTDIKQGTFDTYEDAFNNAVTVIANIFL